MGKKTTLSNRIAVVVLAASLGGAVLLLGVFAGTTLKGFLDIEKDLALLGLSRTLAILDFRLGAIESSVADYTDRGDLRTYLLARKTTDHEAALGTEIPAVLGLDFVAVYGRSDEPLALVNRTGRPVSPELRGKLESRAFRAALPSADRADIVLVEGAAYAVAEVSVADASGEPAGSIVGGRSMDDAFSEELAGLAGLDLRLLPYAEGHGEFRPMERESLKDPLIARSIVNDSAGRPVLLVEARDRRTPFERGYRFFIGFILLSAGGVIAAFIGIYIAARVLLIRPVGILESRLEKGSARPDLIQTELERMSERDDIVGRTAALVLKANEGIERDLEMYMRIMEETSEGIVVTDLAGTVLEVNKAYCTISGYAREEILGRNLRMMKSDRHDDAFYRQMWESILSTGRWEGEVWDKRKNGTIYPKWLSIDTIRDAEGIAERYVGISADITRMKEAEKNLNRMAFYDSLTELPNRALFTDRFLQALARAQRGRTRVALLYLDLDHFKDVNDGYGHHAGDELLCEAATRISAQVREADTVCRIGGDEFTVILESIKKSEDAAAVARKIVEALSEPFTLREAVVYVGASVGIALYPYDGITFEDLVKHADAAMYEAKEHGRGQFRFASGGSGTTSRRKIEMEARLRKALEERSIVVHYQPQVSAGGATYGSSAGIVGAEALVRLRSADGSLIGPEYFIDTAEETGLIVQLGSIVLREACAEAKRWLDAGHPIPVSVNVSSRQFEHALIVEQVAEALEETGLPGKLLRLEVTESLFLRDGDHNAAVIRDLKELGVTFSVDDFGIGYSTLRYIDTLPIDSLKIDKSFIRNIVSRYDGGEVATAVISLARSFGLASVAEGVETSGQLDAIRARGCDEIQGFYVSRPLDAESFRAFIAGELKIPSENENEEPGTLEEVL